MEEYLISVEGRVQGVGFRAFAQREAVGLGLTGFARNAPDGRVEVLVQGEKATLDIFVDRLRIGPRLAAVRNVAIVARTPEAQHGSFEVR
ncbi:MAG: acylphosphatase [Actinomycetota bacterium]|nr:acylphosphatase [Actinomycetota bacterium]